MKYNIYCSNCDLGLAEREDGDFIILRESISYTYDTNPDIIKCVCPRCQEVNVIKDFFVFIRANDPYMGDKYIITEDGSFEIIEDEDEEY